MEHSQQIPLVEIDHPIKGRLMIARGTHADYGVLDPEAPVSETEEDTAEGESPDEEDADETPDPPASRQKPRGRRRS